MRRYPAKVTIEIEADGYEVAVFDQNGQKLASQRHKMISSGHSVPDGDYREFSDALAEDVHEDFREFGEELESHLSFCPFNIADELWGVKDLESWAEQSEGAEESANG